MNGKADDPWSQSALRVAPRRPPWCPTAEDVGFVLDAACPALEARQATGTVLILGVTPEIVQLDWPASANLVAVDSSASMIASTWQPHPLCSSRVICAGWDVMPLDTGSIDVAAGDGSLNALPTFDLYRPVLGEIARVLRPGGVLVLRCFLKPKQPESPAAVVKAAFAGEIATTADFRMRFLMALAGQGNSVALATVPVAFDALVPDRDQIVAATGWPRAHVDLVDIDIDSNIGLTFPTEAEMRDRAEPLFEISAPRHGNYALSNLCPTMVLRRR
jgi:SAM-dependent methyltransferase